MSNELADRIRARAGELKLSQREVARRAGIPESTLRNILAGTSESPRGRTLSAISEALETSEHWLITGQQVLPNELRRADVALPPLSDLPRDVPVLGTVAGSELGRGAFQLSPDVVDYVRRPPGLFGARDAYALYVEGLSMFPKFDQGELVYVHPHRKVLIGDFIVIQEPDTNNGESRGFIKQFVRQTPTLLHTRQFNPEAKLDFVIRPGLTWHKVLTLADLLGV